MKYLCITVRWLDTRYHGQNADGSAEWPPSPLRLFQAMLAGVGRHISNIDEECAMFRWLKKRQAPPIIVAPPVQAGQIFTRFVPNNDSDKHLDRQKRLTAKTISPMLFLNSSNIYYLWPLTDLLTDPENDLAPLIKAARSITSLGWGVDMAVGDGSIMTEEQLTALPGERWLPSEPSSDGLRVPVEGTLDDLIKRHKGFLRRMEGNVFTPPPPLTVFKKVHYRRAFDPPHRQIAAFSLLKSDTSGFRSFDTVRKALTVAGMTRHAAACAAKRAHWSKDVLNKFILGHGNSLNIGPHVSVGNRRFAYLPLPSIEARGDGLAPVVGNVRRVMLTVFDDGYQDEIEWARRMLSGQSLEPEQGNHDASSEQQSNPVAILSLLPSSDPVVKSYVSQSAMWATVTPVVLPGYDDPAHYRRRLKSGTDSEEQKRLLIQLNNRIAVLLRKSIVQAGFSKLLADNAAIEWRKVGFWRGVDLADRYGVPDHLKRFPRYHVKILWRDEFQQPVHIKGPICIGGGRFYGLGLFAALWE